MDVLDTNHPAADGTSSIGWSMQGASQKCKTLATKTCFISGLAVDTTAEQLVLGAKVHGVAITNCHMLPTIERFPDCRATKACIVQSDIDLALRRDFWLHGVRCRLWHSKMKKK